VVAAEGPRASADDRRPALVRTSRVRSETRCKFALLALVATATALLGVTSISSLALSHDGASFSVIARLTNAVWLFGSIALAISLKRAGLVLTLIAVGLQASVRATPHLQDREERRQ
jgi:hypothetical protein